MGKVCYLPSNKDGYILLCERDSNNICDPNTCKEVKVEQLHPQLQIEKKRWENAVARYGKESMKS